MAKTVGFAELPVMKKPPGAGSLRSYFRWDERKQRLRSNAAQASACAQAAPYSFIDRKENLQICNTQPGEGQGKGRTFHKRLTVALEIWSFSLPVRLATARRAGFIRRSAPWLNGDFFGFFGWDGFYRSVRCLLEFFPPLVRLFFFAPFVVEAHQTFERSGELVLFRTGHLGLALFHSFVSRPKQGLSVGVLLLIQKRFAQERFRLESNPVVRLYFLAYG